MLRLNVRTLSINSKIYAYMYTCTYYYLTILLERVGVKYNIYHLFWRDNRSILFLFFVRLYLGDEIRDEGEVVDILYYAYNLSNCLLADTVRQTVKSIVSQGKRERREKRGSREGAKDLKRRMKVDID